MKRNLLSFLFPFFSLLCFTSNAQLADLILTNGKLFTANSSMPYAEAIAIKGDRIIAVGTTAAITKLAGGKTKKIDLRGRTVIPGINDAHDHIGYGTPVGKYIAFTEPMLPGPSFQQVLDSLAVAVKQVPKGTLIQGDLGLKIIEDSNARRMALDRVAPNHPVILNAPWGHGTLLNTKAMEMLDINETSPDPVGGRYERIAGTRKLSGFFSEYAEFAVKRKWYSKLPNERLVQGFKKFGDEALRMGITSVQNMATSLELDKMVSVLKEANLPLRIRVIRFPASSEKGRNLSTWSKTYASTPLLTVSGMKWILDGTPLERGAYMQTAYSDNPQTKGRLNFPLDTVKQIIKEGLASREQLLLHIVGDYTPNLVLAEMKKAADAKKWTYKRVRFEHADGLLQDQWKEAKDLGIVAVVNPSHFTFAEVNHLRVGEARVKTYQPMRSFIEAGIPVAIGSDGPNNPYLNIMFAAMHPTNPSEAVTREQAVVAYTKGSAYSEFKEKEKGMLKAGMLADLAVLSQDIFTIPLQELPRTSSLLTIVGGKIVYDAGTINNGK
ncbi:MAG: amidohydrolase [Chitinophagaceae bacterium]|nr:MAG: amidohydrolase [Chitinophagaceae bacterium]